MKLYLLVFSLCLCVDYIFSVLVVKGADKVSVFSDLKLNSLTAETEDKLENHAKAYYEFRTKLENSTKDLVDGSLPGIVCLFTVKLGSSNAIVIHYSGEKLKGTTIRVDPNGLNFVYDEYKEEPGKSLVLGHAFGIGKQFIRQTLNNDPVVQKWTKKGVNSAGYNYLKFHGKKDGVDQGDHLLFTVIYTVKR